MPTDDPFAQMLPTIMELGREKRAQNRQAEQAKKATDIFTRLTRDPSVHGEERAMLFAQSARLGLNPGAAYAFDLVDVSKYDWDQEIKDAYNSRNLTFPQALAAHTKVSDKLPTLEESTAMYWQSSELQAQFPATPEVTGPQRLRNFFEFQQYAGTVATNKIYGTGAASELDVFDKKVKIIKSSLGDDIPFEEAISSPQRLALLDLAGITYDDLAKFYNFDMSAVAKAKQSVLNQITASNKILGIDLAGTLANWRKGTLKNEQLGGILDEYYDKDSGELKGEVVLKELSSLRKLTIQNMGLGNSGIPDRLQNIITSLKSMGIHNKSELERLLQEGQDGMGPNGKYDGLANPNWTIGDLKEAAKYLE